MKIRLLMFLSLLGLGVWLGYLILTYPGYIQISFQQISIETNLWFALAIMLLSFLLLHWIINICSNIFLPLHSLKSWMKNKHHHNSQERTLEGIMHLLKGEGKKAEDKLIKAAQLSEQPLINYLAAALAAGQQDKSHQADLFLKEAEQHQHKEQFVITLVRCYLEIENGQYKSAQADLLNLEEQAPDSLYVLNMLVQCCQILEDYEQLKRLLSKIRQHKIMTEKQLLELEQKLAELTA